MICLAPTELVTDAERQLFRVLTSLGPGTNVLGGLAVFVPVVEGAMQRRQADAVAFLPETVVVVRAVAMSGRQSGELRPNASGMWTVGGELLRLSGGGTNPTGQLRKAVELVRATLDAGGLDPGTPPGLVAIDGSITSVRDRSAGGPVACSLDAGEVLTGLRHCANIGAHADRRVWTTADVRAALAIFGLQGRGPSVEELNGEGFLYSPYVLRRPQAGAVLADREAAGALSTTPRPGAVRTAAAPPPTVAAPVSVGALGPGPREVSEPSTAAGESTDGTGRDVGLSGLFDDEPGSSPAPVAPSATVRGAPRPGRPAAARPGTPKAVKSGRGPAAPSAPPKGGASKRGTVKPPKRRTPWFLVVALLLIAGAGVAGVRYASGLDNSAGSPAAQNTTGATSTSLQATSDAAPPPPIQVVGDVTYTLQASRADTDCVTNSYGQVSEYFAGTPCTGLIRALFTVTLDGAPAVISVSEVQLSDDEVAAEFRTLVDSSGTGNVSDLLRSGVPLEGGPSELVAGAYTSELSGSTVRIVEVAWVDEALAGDDATLEAAAEDALTLDLPPV